MEAHIPTTSSSPGLSSVPLPVSSSSHDSVSVRLLYNTLSWVCSCFRKQVLASRCDYTVHTRSTSVVLDLIQQQIYQSRPLQRMDTSHRRYDVKHVSFAWNKCSSIAFCEFKSIALHCLSPISWGNLSRFKLLSFEISWSKISKPFTNMNWGVASASWLRIFSFKVQAKG